VGGCHKERFKEIGNLLGGCKEEGFELIAIEEECA
jgi:hypothetical protein